MKSVKLLLIAVTAFFLVTAPAFSATVLTDDQIAEIATIVQAGGDAGQAAEEMMAGITSDLIVQGLTGDELQATIAIALQEMTSGLDAGAANFEAAVSGILEGGTSGAVLGVNQAVGADPNLDAAALTSSVTKGAAGAVAAIAAANPGIDTAGLQAAVNQGAQSQGAAPLEPEAFEPVAPPAPAAPPAPPTVEAPEPPPTQDDQAASPV